MRCTVVCYLFVSLVVGSALAHIAGADEPRDDRSKDERRADEALELTRELARSLQFYGGKDRTRKLTLVESPLQRFSNPVVGEFYAHLFIWTNKGRPDAAAAIQKWYKPMQAVHVELQSLAVDEEF